MANIKSQKKRIITSELQRQRNVAQRSKIRTMEKRAVVSVEAGAAEEAAANVKAAISAIDRACSKGVLHRNQAARRKSILQNSLNRMASE